ncbi:flagellar basal body-associated FliL family protein [Endozoicomonas lisbonensis]|uniref:Flagellar protein FliL n=1 Tax=Endozoicomonas lisbonensis TaxID=3120522 RepID=A0ABV2SDC5_9GAMM
MSKEKTGFVRTVSFAVLALVGIAVIWFWVLSGRAGAGMIAPKPVYYEMEPVVVNVSRTGASNRYFKVKPVLVVSHDSSFKEIKHYSPVIRSRLIALYSRESVEGLLAEDGFDSLREKSLAEVHGVIGSNDGVHSVSEVLFNEYVIQ